MAKRGANKGGGIQQRMAPKGGIKKQAPKRLLAAWAPLVPVDASNGGVELSPGSHRLGYLKHQRDGGFMTVAGQACEPGGSAAMALASGGSTRTDGGSSSGEGVTLPVMPSDARAESDTRAGRFGACGPAADESPVASPCNVAARICC